MKPLYTSLNLDFKSKCDMFMLANTILFCYVSVVLIQRVVKHVVYYGCSFSFCVLGIYILKLPIPTVHKEHT